MERRTHQFLAVGFQRLLGANSPAARDSSRAIEALGTKRLKTLE
jgi:hypothetical protein